MYAASLCVSGAVIHWPRGSRGAKPNDQEINVHARRNNDPINHQFPGTAPPFLRAAVVQRESRPACRRRDPERYMFENPGDFATDVSSPQVKYHQAIVNLLCSRPARR